MNPLILQTLAAVGAQVLRMLSSYVSGELSDDDLMKLWGGLADNMANTKRMFDEAVKTASEQKPAGG